MGAVPYAALPQLHQLLQQLQPGPGGLLCVPPVGDRRPGGACQAGEQPVHHHPEGGQGGGGPGLHPRGRGQAADE